MRISDLGVILKQLLLLLFSLAILSGVLLVVSLLLLPPPSKDQPMDTFRAGDTVYLTPPRMIYYGRASLRNAGPKLLLLGSSNTQVGFDQTKLAPRFDNLTVHNLGTGDANITEIVQIADLAIGSAGEETIDEHIILVGIWYGMFVDDESRWAVGPDNRFETDIDNERFRYGFQTRSENGPVVRISDRGVDKAVLLIHPFLALEKGIRLITADLRSLFFVRPPRIDQKTRNEMIFSDEQRASANEYRRRYMNTDVLSAEQYDVLVGLLRDLSERGATVIVADLPIPAWHAQGLPYDQDHQTKMAAIIPEIEQLDGISYLDMRALNDDDSFYDDAHVRPRSQQPWTDALYDAVKDIESARKNTPSE